MEGIFLEFENENALRSYPFASGCTTPEDADAIIDPGVFVDAALYPVDASGVVYLSEVDENGVFYISDDTGVIMTGSVSGEEVRFRDTTELLRHVGTLVASSADVLSEFAFRGVQRQYAAENTAFASSCVFPVVIDGVKTLNVGDTGMIAGEMAFANASTDTVRVSSTVLLDGRQTLRFDVIPRPTIVKDYSIRRVICVVDGQTPFRIEKLDYNTVMLRLENVDKSVICTAAHRENQYEMADVCPCEQGECKEYPKEDPLPDIHQLEEVFIPPDPMHTEGGLSEGSENAFYLVVPNVVGYDNPLSLTLEDGAVVPKTDDLEVVVDGNEAKLAEGEMIDTVSSKGVVLQVPGLSGGAI